MDFALSEDQQLLQQTVQGFLERECPAARVRELYDADEPGETALWREAAELGLAGLAIPEAHGGAGFELLELALVSEVLGEGAAPLPFLGHSLAALAVLGAGSPQQRETWLPRLASGAVLASVALGESADAWEPDRWTVECSEERLTGVKRYVTGASGADLLVVGLAGGELALLEPGAPGCSLEPLDTLDRTRRLSGLRLEGAPAERLPEGVAFAPRLRDAGLVLLAADAFGSAWSLLRKTIDYLGTREQFGTRITQFQAVKHELANLATELEPARGLYWFSAHAFDHVPDEAERSAALAKAHVTDRSLDVARRAVELHGGIGFTWECDAHIWLKRTMFDRSYLGGPDSHRDRCARLAGW